jgi:hypothetical protein
MAAYLVEVTTKEAKSLPVIAHRTPAVPPPTSADTTLTFVLVTKMYANANTNETMTMGMSRPAKISPLPNGSMEVNCWTSAVDEIDAIMPMADNIRIGPTRITLR